MIDLKDIDITSHVRKIDGIDFLPWSACLQILRKEGYHVTYGLRLHPVTHYPAFFSPDGKTAFVRVWVHLESTNFEDKFEVEYPVAEGFKSVEFPDSFAIDKAKQRGFVKAVAIHTGLGLHLWEKEIDAIDRDEVRSLFSKGVIKLGTSQNVFAHLGMTPKEVDKMSGQELSEAHVKLTELFKDDK